MVHGRSLATLRINGALVRPSTRSFGVDDHLGRRTVRHALVLHVHARAVDGAASQEVIVAVADVFDLGKGAVTLARGATSRATTLNLKGDNESLGARLRELRVQTD